MGYSSQILRPALTGLCFAQVAPLKLFCPAKPYSKLHGNIWTLFLLTPHLTVHLDVVRGNV